MYNQAATNLSSTAPALPPNTVPNVPPTQAQVDVAKAAKPAQDRAARAAARAAAAPAPVPIPPAPVLPAPVPPAPVLPAPVLPAAGLGVPPAGPLNPQQQIQALQARIQQLQNQLQQAQQPDKYPYSFWPDPPWHTEPSVRMTKPISVRDWEQQNHEPPAGLAHDNWERNRQAIEKRWLDTKPLQWAVDERRWHGVKFLGRGSYGCAGLWVQTDAQDTIIDVSSNTD